MLELSDRIQSLINQLLDARIVIKQLASLDAVHGLTTSQRNDLHLARFAVHDVTIDLSRARKRMQRMIDDVNVALGDTEPPHE